MKLLTGIYTARFDDKGRLSLPSRLRIALSADELVVLPGLDGNHLMLMTVEYFEKEFTAPILSSPMATLDRKKRMLIRKIISPAQYAEIDGSGRINISPQIRSQCALPNKSEVLILGTGYTIELWNPEIYKELTEDDKATLSELAEELYREERDAD